MAIRLAKMDKERRLHIALTHGMAPFEPFDTRLEKAKPGLCRRLLKKAMNDSKKAAKSDDLAIVKAYRATKASEECYPNTAELLKAVIGTNKLSGGITEVNCEKHKKLADAWSGSFVVPERTSWRKQIHPHGRLACPDKLQTPWLFAMDPMTYIEKGYADDDKLYRSDLKRLSDVLTGYIQSGKPGVAALFVYRMSKNSRCQFWNFMDSLAELVSAATSSYWLTHNGGNRNLAGLLYSGLDLSSGFEFADLNKGRVG